MTTIFLLVFELFFMIIVTSYLVSLVYSSLKGSPFVSTNQKLIKKILNEVSPRKNQVFIELGCGDGRVVQTAVKYYGVKGLGIDVNPLIILLAKIRSKINKINNVEYRVADIFQTDLSRADILYLFLMPSLIRKLVPKLAKELKKGTIVISHGFVIEAWQKNCFKTLDDKPFLTYFYKI